jgi:hypothetical protein
MEAELAFYRVAIPVAIGGKSGHRTRAAKTSLLTQSGHWASDFAAAQCDFSTHSANLKSLL